MTFQKIVEIRDDLIELGEYAAVAGLPNAEDRAQRAWDAIATLWEQIVRGTSRAEAIGTPTENERPEPRRGYGRG